MFGLRNKKSKRTEKMLTGMYRIKTKSILELTALDVFEKWVYDLLLVYYMEYLIETS